MVTRLGNPSETWDVFIANEVPGLVPVPLREDWNSNGYLRDIWTDPSAVFILDPLGGFDAELNEYFSGADTIHLSPSTKLDYARDVARFCTFMWNAREPKQGRRLTWKDATPADRMAFYRFRNTVVDGPRVKPSTWAREVVAVAGLYRTALDREWIAEDPILRRPSRSSSRRSPWGVQADVPREIRPGSTRRRTDWIPPGDYRLWRETGVRGFSPKLLPRDEHRGRQSSRDRSFTDLMVTTGMRLKEQTVLLKSEVPAMKNAYSRLLLPGAITKNRVPRLVYIPASVLRAIDGYARTDRKRAVGLARQSRTYERDSQRVILRDSSARIAVGPAGDRHKLDDLSPEQRMHLYIDGEAGLEPAALWLTETGKPMQSSSWQSVFRSANDRCAKAGLPELRVHPHMLRHTFATVLLHQLERLYLTQTSGKQANDPSLAALHLGDPLKWVKVRLGHASIETTERYCHPLQELETDTLMELIPDIWGELAVPSREELELSGTGVQA